MLIGSEDGRAVSTQQKLRPSAPANSTWLYAVGMQNSLRWFGEWADLPLRSTDRHPIRADRASYVQPTT